MENKNSETSFHDGTSVHRFKSNGILLKRPTKRYVVTFPPDSGITLDSLLETLKEMGYSEEDITINIVKDEPNTEVLPREDN